jgi:hypothetical protein
VKSVAASKHRLRNAKRLGMLKSQPALNRALSQISRSIICFALLQMMH